MYTLFDTVKSEEKLNNIQLEKDALRENLEELVKFADKMNKKVTIYSIAEELGYTPSMVSRALSENGKVSEEKRKKILFCRRFSS